MDYHGIEYEICYLPPGLHSFTAKKLGAPGTSLPILVADGQVVQGSSNIIDWAEAQSTAVSIRLTPNTNIDACRELEKRLDDVAGVHVRRYYYSEALIDHPEIVRQVFANDLSFFKKLVLYGTWGVVRKLMIDLMDLGPEQGRESRKIIEKELAWIDSLISDGRRFLVGDKFSRADVTAASLLAPLAIPNEHPTYAKLKLPPHMTADLAIWEDRPSIKWVNEIYSQYRQCMPDVD